MNSSMNIDTMSRRSFVRLAVAAGATAAGALVLGGCSQAAPASSSASSSAAEQTARVVIDAKGNEFTIPEKVERIAITCNGGTTHEVAIFGGADKIVAQPSMSKFPQLLKMYPQFNDVVNAGSFDDLNIEAMVATEPDVALVGVSSDKGNAQIADVGIPTYVMLIGWAAVDTLKQEFLNVGKIVGDEQKAEDLVAHWDRVLGGLAEKVAAIPESERKKVYYLSAPDVTKANLGDWGRTWVDTVGGVFAVPEADLNGDVTIEKALEWDPDVIVIQGGKDINAIYESEQVQDMKAIKSKQVFSVPIAGFWWDRPSPEATLGFLWLAQTVYPDYMADIDLKAETFAFFKEFYGYELTDEEYLSFFG